MLFDRPVNVYSDGQQVWIGVMCNKTFKHEECMSVGQNCWHESFQHGNKSMNSSRFLTMF